MELETTSFARFGFGGKEVSFAFPEGRELVKGWALLAEKLRFLGITPWSKGKNISVMGEFEKQGLRFGEKEDFVEVVQKNKGSEMLFG